MTFLQTLTDGFTTPYPDINTFTGQCMTGGTAATQGNELPHSYSASAALRIGYLRCRTYARAESCSIAVDAGRAIQVYETCATRSVERHAPCRAVPAK